MIMERDKAKDDELFNCSQQHELEYVAGLYENGNTVHVFLSNKCKGHQIFFSTHDEVYKLIEEELGFPVPE